MRENPDFVADDLVLARLASQKLLGLVWGLLTAGFAVVQLRSPRLFFDGRDKRILAFAEVLCAIGGKPGSKSDVQHQQISAQLLSAVGRYYKALTGLSEWREMSVAELEGLGEELASSYSALIEIVIELSRLWGIELEPILPSAQASEFIRQGIKTLLAAQRD